MHKVPRPNPSSGVLISTRDDRGDAHHNLDMSSLDLDASKQLQATLDNANLYILNSRAQLKSYRFDGLEDLATGEDALKDPAIVASDVAAQTVRA